jgi:hypothetical protein
MVTAGTTRWRRALLWPWALMLLCSACAGSRMGVATVRLEQGQPCFGIADNESGLADGLQLQALALSDVSTLPAKQVWTLLIDLDATALRLQPGQCVGYLERPAGYQGPVSPELVPGRVYDIFVNARPAGGRTSTQGYNLRFCLRPGPPVKVQTLAPNAPRCSAP